MSHQPQRQRGSTPASLLRPTGAALILAAWGLATGCSRLPGPDNSFSVASADVTLEVENRNFSDVTVYATDGDSRVRVGRVTGKTSEEFTFRWYQTDIFMEIDFTGGGRLFSPRQIVVPGEVDNFLLVIGISPNGPVMLTGRQGP